MADARVRVGIAACGAMGTGMAGRLADVPDMGVLTAVADAVPERAQALAEQYGVKKVHDDWSGVCEDPDVDAVYVPLPHTLHHAAVMRAVEHDKHVYVEKPLAMTMKQATEMVEAAEAKGLKMQVNLSYRFRPAVHQFRDLLQSGKVGRITHVHTTRGGDMKANIKRTGRTWYGEREHGGMLWGVAIHNLDMALFCIGDEAQEVFGYHLCTAPEPGWTCPDQCAFTGRTRRGIILSGFHSWVAPIPTEATAIGTAGTLKLGGVAGISFNNEPLDLGQEPHVLSGMADFLDAIRTDRRPIADGRDTLPVIALIEGIDRATETHQVTRL